jgi:hypothetical protein
MDSTGSVNYLLCGCPAGSHHPHGNLEACCSDSGNGIDATGSPNYAVCGCPAGGVSESECVGTGITYDQNTCGCACLAPGKVAFYRVKSKATDACIEYACGDADGVLSDWAAPPNDVLYRIMCPAGQTPYCSFAIGASASSYACYDLSCCEGRAVSAIDQWIADPVPPKTGACYHCQVNFYWNGSSCIACPANATCNDDTIVCNSGYNLFENECITNSCPGDHQWKRATEDYCKDCSTPADPQSATTVEDCIGKCVGYRYVGTNQSGAPKCWNCGATSYSVSITPGLHEKTESSCNACLNRYYSNGKCVCDSDHAYNSNTKCCPPGQHANSAKTGCESD